VRLGAIDDVLEMGLRLGERPAFGGDVAVVEAEARNAELGDELERRVELRLGGAERVLGRVPLMWSRMRA